MPKKTRKQKLLARHHRLHARANDTANYSSPKQEDTASSPFTFTFQKKTAPGISDQPTKTQTIEFRAIQRDIIKTLGITACIIISEFLLSRYMPH